ncbi:MAG: biopolymer transporter ExbD [Fuerstiella sp.]
MPLRTDSLEEPQLNLTPMIDIVFLLIIFFMVGTKFSEIEQQFDVDLPSASAIEPMSSTPDPMIVAIAKSGDLSLANETVTAEQLEQNLIEAKTTFSGQVILIRGDGQGSYQSIIDIMALCNRLKLKFSLAFQPQEQ